MAGFKMMPKESAHDWKRWVVIYSDYRDPKPGYVVLPEDMPQLISNNSGIHEAIEISAYLSLRHEIAKKNAEIERLQAELQGLRGPEQTVSPMPREWGGMVEP